MSSDDAPRAPLTPSVSDAGQRLERIRALCDSPAREAGHEVRREWVSVRDLRAILNGEARRSDVPAAGGVPAMKRLLCWLWGGGLHDMDLLAQSYGAPWICRRCGKDCHYSSLAVARP